MSSAADDSPEMSRLKISNKKKINKYKFIFFFFLLQLWLALFGLIKTVQKAALDCILTHKAPSKIFFVVYLFFRENKSWNFMWSICLGDDSPEMSRLFSEKINK